MLTLSDIADLVKGELIGSGDCQISEVSSLRSATSGSLSFYSNPQQVDQLTQCDAGVVLLRKEDMGLFHGNRILVSDPHLAYAKISRKFREPSWHHKGIHTTAIIDEDASIHPGVSIGAYSIISHGAQIGQGVLIGSHVVIGANVNIGAGTEIENQVVIHNRSKIGERCYLSSGVVVGGNGFGYAQDGSKWEKVEQLGSVNIGDDVDIGANTTIDRGTLDDTIIGNGVKLDNQIQIAHNVSIGDHTIMAGCVAVAGSAKIGKRCRFGGRASVLGHLDIVDDVVVYANSLVASSIRQKGGYASMIPVQKVNIWRKTVANLNRLDRLSRKIRGFGKPGND